MSAVILIESGASANAGTGVHNPLSRAASLIPVEFQEASAQFFVVDQNWDGLENLLSEFLTKVQGNKFYPHPGLFCSLYQAWISSLTEEKKFEDAEAIFNDKVQPLLDHKDDMYAPLDLEYRVDLLEKCVDEGLPIPADEVEDMNVVLSDYIKLYFPTSLQSEPYRTKSVSDFVATFNDKKGKQHHRCLACQQVLPAPATSRSIVDHIKHRKEDNVCHRVTQWMREYLVYVKGEREIDSQKSRKRKQAPPPTVPDLDQQSVVVPLELVLQIQRDLDATIMLALLALAKDESQSAAKSKAKKILHGQVVLISEMTILSLRSMVHRAPLNSSLAFLKIKTLLNLSDDLFNLLKDLPCDVSELLLKQDKKATELRSCFMVAAAGRLPSTAPVDVMSSTDSC